MNAGKCYENLFAHFRDKITILVDAILRTQEDAEINSLISELVVVANRHIIEKMRCFNNGILNENVCNKSLQVVNAGLRLVEACPRRSYTIREKQNIVCCWYRDNYWMIEAECLYCKNLSHGDDEDKESKREEHIGRVKKY